MKGYLNYQKAIHLFFICFFSSQTLSAGFYDSFFDCFSSPHSVSIGSEVYYVERLKKEGVKQTGVLQGGNLSYERLKCKSLYLSLDSYYAEGKLCGKSNDWCLVSKKIDLELMGKVGWTFFAPAISSFSITPFVGYGWCREKNNFIPPTPLKLHFLTTCEYFAYGMKIYWWCQCMHVGLDVTLKSLSDGSTRVLNDPEFHNSELFFEFCPHFSVEIPMHLQKKISRGCLDISLVPFFRQRHYGERENFPFTFVDTKICNIGLRTGLGWFF